MARITKTVFKTALEFDYVKEAVNGNKHFIVTDNRSYCVQQFEKYGNALNRGRLIEMALRLYAGESIAEYEQNKAINGYDSWRFGNIKSANGSICYDVDGVVPTLSNWETLLAEYMRRYGQRFTYATLNIETRTITAWTFNNPEDATKWMLEYMARFTTDSRESTHGGQVKIGLKPETKKAIKALEEMVEGL